MQSGIISLQPLYEFVYGDKEGEGLKGHSIAGRNYGKKATEIVQTILDQPGFYLWGKYEKNGMWKNIYLGKAGFNRTTNLQRRIREELKDEGSFLWLQIMDEKRILSIGEANYPSMWHKYKAQYERAFLKKGSTHIVWVYPALKTNDAVKTIESDLIETLNPVANILHPVPPISLQCHTRDIVASFRSEVHDHRSKRYEVRNMLASR